MARMNAASFAQWMDRAFPERQIYYRSNGVVHFYSLSRQFQIALSALTCALVIWVGYTSVNVVFKNQIIEAKDRRAASMQKAYESKIAELQLANDDIRGLLATAELRFERVTRELETKHAALEGLLTAADGKPDREAQLVAPVRRTDQAEYVPMSPWQGEAAGRVARAADNAPVQRADANFAPLLRRAFSGSAEPAKPIRRLSDRVFSTEARLAALSQRQVALIDRARVAAEAEVLGLEAVIARTRLPVGSVLALVKPDDFSAQGGPLLPLSTALSGVDADFDRRLAQLAALERRADETAYALTRLPILKPVENPDISSDFGPRIDPFTRRPAFHAGLDFRGPVGTPIFAASAGKVVYAGWRGAYGRLVEIDHGYGIHTRYGHLSRIDVEVGDEVAAGARVGALGSSGRSTGPHLHYEVWFGGKVKDPMPFLEAGRHVLFAQ